MYSMDRMVNRGRMRGVVDRSNGGGCMMSRVMAASRGVVAVSPMITVVGPVMMTSAVTGHNADKSSDNQKL